MIDAPKRSRFWASALATTIVSVASLFYVYEFFLRVVPSALTGELMREFHLDASTLGTMSSLFFYAYIPMQIPAGILGDRYGPRLLLTCAALICTIAIFWFSHTDHYTVMLAARFLIGFASAFAFIGPLMLAQHWFHPKHFAMITGLIQLMGCLGAIFGGAPLALLSQKYGWHETLYGAAGVGLVLFVLFWLVIRDYPKDYSHSTHTSIDTQSERQRVKIVCHNPQTWAVGLVGMTCWMPVVTFAALWGIPFLQTIYHTDAAHASSMTLWMWAGIAIGSPLIGWWSDKIGSRKLPLYICFSLAVISSLVVVLMHHLDMIVMDIALFLFGFSASSQVVTFGLVADNNPPGVAGTSVAVNNMAVIFGGLIFQPLIGFILRAVWDHKILGGIPVYSAQAYTQALISIPIGCAIGLLATAFLVKETHCQPQYGSKGAQT